MFSRLGGWVSPLRAFVPSSLRIATLRLTEILGTALLFCTINLAVGVATILALRFAAGWFLSVYFLNDLSLLVLSGLQALLFDSWRRTPGRDRAPVTRARSGADDLG